MTRVWRDALHDVLFGLRPFRDRVVLTQIFSPSLLQDNILRDVILEERCAHLEKGSKRGYSQVVLDRMWALHHPVTHKADHDRVKAALPGTQAVLNRAAGMYKKGQWPHEIAAAG